MSRKQLPYFPLGSVRKKKSWVEYLDDFADEMAGMMEKAMQKGGDRSPTPWKYNLDFLRRRLAEEFDEWNLDVKCDRMSESGELLDIANFCYFLWVRLNKVRQEEVKMSE